MTLNFWHAVFICILTLLLYPLVEARCDSVVDVVKGSCGGVFGFEAVLCMMLWDVVSDVW